MASRGDIELLEQKGDGVEEKILEMDDDVEISTWETMENPGGVQSVAEIAQEMAVECSRYTKHAKNNAKVFNKCDKTGQGYLLHEACCGVFDVKRWLLPEEKGRSPMGLAFEILEKYCKIRNGFMGAKDRIRNIIFMNETEYTVLKTKLIQDWLPSEMTKPLFVVVTEQGLRLERGVHMQWGSRKIISLVRVGFLQFSATPTSGRQGVSLCQRVMARESNVITYACITGQAVSKYHGRDVFKLCYTVHQRDFPHRPLAVCLG